MASARAGNNAAEAEVAIRENVDAIGNLDEKGARSALADLEEPGMQPLSLSCTPPVAAVATTREASHPKTVPQCGLRPADRVRLQ